MLSLWNGRRVALGLMRLLAERAFARPKRIAVPAKPEEIETLRTLKGEIVLCIRSRAKYLRIVRSLVTSLCADTPLCASDVDDLTLAVGEAVANALRHGSPKGSKDFVLVCCRMNEIGVTVEVKDQGKGIGKMQADTHRKGQLSEGGYGIPLMRQLSDFLGVDSGQSGTVVTISKFFPVTIGRA